jgi:hypothetical protein
MAYNICVPGLPPNFQLFLPTALDAANVTFVLSSATYNTAIAAWASAGYPNTGPAYNTFIAAYNTYEYAQAVYYGVLNALYTTAARPGVPGFPISVYPLAEVV